MSFKQWWAWYKGSPLYKKWFILLILLRPLIDNFYELKETSALASPLYIVGILTPILILLSTVAVGFPKATQALEAIPFRIWAILVVFNAATFWFINLSVVAFGDLIKYTTPVLLFFYARRIVQSKADLHGILTTFLISCLFPFTVFLYESFVNPIAIEYISQGRGGGSRIRGAYADVMNYAIFFILFLLIMSYYFVQKLYSAGNYVQVKTWHIVFTIFFVAYGLTSINHVSSWGVFFALIIILLAHNLRNTRGLLFVFVFLFIIGSFFAQDLYIDHIEPLIGKELLIVEGESDTDQAFNGRMTRWEKYFETWEQMPPINHFIGITTANFKETVIMIGGGMHSDYVRLLFMTGFIGLFFYIVFLISVLSRWVRLAMPEKYLIAATSAMMILWSITTVPTLYAPLLYIVYPIIAFVLLPKNQQV